MKPKKTILIVDDEIHLTETWKEILDHFEYHALVASNAIEAIQQIESNNIDLIITDLQMPVADGWVLLDYLKENESNIKTIVCTGYTQEKRIKAEYQVVKVLHKPFSIINEINRLKEII